jgi:hypothetical protein
MILLNFTHPIPADQLERITQLTGQSVETVVALPTQFDHALPFIPQVEALIDQIALTPEQWQTAPLLVVLPSLNYIAATVLAELHGRMGYFPPVVRLRPVENALPPRFEVSEIINLQSVRENARKKRL